MSLHYGYGGAEDEDYPWTDEQTEHAEVDDESNPFEYDPLNQDEEDGMSDPRHYEENPHLDPFDDAEQQDEQPPDDEEEESREARHARHSRSGGPSGQASHITHSSVTVKSSSWYGKLRQHLLLVMQYSISPSSALMHDLERLDQQLDTVRAQLDCFSEVEQDLLLANGGLNRLFVDVKRMIDHISRKLRDLYCERYTKVREMMARLPKDTLAQLIENQKRIKACLDYMLEVSRPELVHQNNSAHPQSTAAAASSDSSASVDTNGITSHTSQASPSQALQRPSSSQGISAGSLPVRSSPSPATSINSNNTATAPAAAAAAPPPRINTNTQDSSGLLSPSSSAKKANLVPILRPLSQATGQANTVPPTQPQTTQTCSQA